MKEGDVAPAMLPPADGCLKRRPVMVLCEMPPFGDWLACGVSTQLKNEVPGFDEVVKKLDPDFATSSLKQESLSRLGFLVVLPVQEIVGRMAGSRQFVTIACCNSSRHTSVRQ
jgi:mRNA interferase MazF